jgi:hypothetical protein
MYTNTYYFELIEALTKILAQEYMITGTCPLGCLSTVTRKHYSFGGIPVRVMVGSGKFAIMNIAEDEEKSFPNIIISVNCCPICGEET